MPDHPERDRGAQEEKPGERETRRAQATRQDFTRRMEGRDVPPDAVVLNGQRTRDSPWMGGG